MNKCNIYLFLVLPTKQNYKGKRVRAFLSFQMPRRVACKYALYKFIKVHKRIDIKPRVLYNVFVIN